MNIEDFLTDQVFDDSEKQNTGPLGNGGPLVFLGIFAFLWSLIQFLARLLFGL